MTRDDLLALLATGLSHQPQRVEGGTLFRHMPHEGDQAYLCRVYDPALCDLAIAWFDRADLVGHPYFSFVTEVANGLRVANINLNGVIEQIDRSVGPHAGQPVSLDHANLMERPSHLKGGDLVIGGMVGWSSEGDFVMDRKGAVRLVHASNGDDVAEEWPSLEAMLRAELPRLAGQHDAEGRLLTTYTDLMHPNGRRWETEAEPGSTRH